MSSRTLVIVWLTLMVVMTTVVAQATDADLARVVQWWAWGMVGLVIGRVSSKT